MQHLQSTPCSLGGNRQLFDMSQCQEARSLCSKGALAPREAGCPGEVRGRALRASTSPHQGPLCPTVRGNRGTPEASVCTSSYRGVCNRQPSPESRMRGQASLLLCVTRCSCGVEGGGSPSSRGPCGSHEWPACQGCHAVDVIASREFRWPGLQVPAGRYRAAEGDRWSMSVAPDRAAY